MPGRVAAVLLLLSSLSIDSIGQDRFLPRYSGQFRSTVYDVAVDGSFVWTATDYGVQLLEQTSRGPELVDAVALRGPTRVIASNGNGFAYAGSGSHLAVLRRNGSSIEVLGDISITGAFNDILLMPTQLFAATSRGIKHYDLTDPTHPIPRDTVLTTSSQNVTSLALFGQKLYAADGDATVEIFDVSVPSIPQRTGALDALPRSVEVHVASDGFVYVSDQIGQNTDIFSGNARLARVPYGSLSFAAMTGGAAFLAGSDRTLRALDLSNTSRPAELFEQQLAPTGGSANGIFELLRSGNTLYVAAGDLGLLTFDVSTLASPFPLVSYGGGATTSALILPGSVPKAYFTTQAAITENSLDLVTLRTRAQAAPAIVHDSRGSDLLVSSENKVTLSNLDVTSFEATFPAAVREAFVVGDSVIALLADQSVWSVNTTAGSTPQRVDTGGAKISYLARSGSTYAMAELREVGDSTNTIIHLPDKKLTITGAAATGGLAMSATHVAFFTFRGINLVDIASGAVTTLPDSTGILPKQLLFADNDLLVLGDRKLAVWNTTTRTLTREHPLPANAVRMHAAAQRAAIATDEGMLVLNYLAQLPAPVSEPYFNRYYTKLVAGRDQLYLLGDDGVDVYSTVIGLAPRFVTAVREPGIFDIAANDEMFFTLSGSGELAAYSRAGVEVARTVVELGPGSQPLAVFAVGDSAWVTISSGCMSGVCQQSTFVLDPETLEVVGMMQGGVMDVEVYGTRAYALLDLPAEIVVLDISNPLFPDLIAHIDAPPNATSIAATRTRVFVLGDKLHVYEPSLVEIEIDAVPAETPATPEQQIEAAGEYLLMIGRSANSHESPKRMDPESLIRTLELIEVPSAPRMLAVQPGRFYLLTEHSIEVWTLEPAPTTTRRRSTR